MNEIQKDLITKGWEDYKAQVLPANCPEIQFIESRRAFFAGASILFFSVLDLLDEEEEVTEKDLLQLQAVQEEILNFAKMVMERRA